ncbi:MAG TPA: pirin family protein [Nitrospiria bacterium]|nr:pirin family protein [Nitrospiria bacterium]
MGSVRKIRKTFQGKPTVEGAGVKLKRGFGFPEVPLLDPFLLLDDFHSMNPEDYLAGFPWHPHRGIETITYVLRGRVLHKDSMGHSGEIGEGEVQWMTAGSGIIHEEMPQRTSRGVWGFQLWANLPASQKMIDPRYQSISPDQIPEVGLNREVKAKVISGTANGVSGPVRDVVIDPEYLDVTVGPETVYEHPVKEGHTAFCYVIEGEGTFDPDGSRAVSAETVVLFEDGELIRIASGKVPLRFLMISGRPLREPVAWYGPIVMNTREELQVAFEEYRNGTFIKRR